MMCGKFGRLQLARHDDLQKHRQSYRIDQTGRKRDVTVPQLFEMQLCWLSVDAHICKSATGSYNRLTDVKRFGFANSFHGNVHTCATGEF